MSAWLLAIPALVCAGGAIYQILGAVLVAHWLRENELPNDYGELPPITFLRPVKAGVPRLRAKLDRLARAMRPGDQLILGAAAVSAELNECEALRRAFADREIVVVPCREGAALNPKISKLVQMDSACRHERLILSDSEAMIDAGWLDAFRCEWHSSGADALTAGYRFVGATHVDGHTHLHLHPIILRTLLGPL
ncbi:MAG TPA: glycosyltransferase, partial [Chthoniobacteraceae bacterium]|nr:glycosyltransferase [Chthoniobacteraceae bacterium]